MAEYGALEQPHVRVKLINELALGVLDGPQLGKIFGCTKQAISVFKRRHAVRIAEVQRRLDDQFAAIEYGNVVARVASLSDQILRVERLLRDEKEMAKVGFGRAEMERVIQTGHRAIAEQTGQLIARTHVQVAGKLDVVINGIDTDLLR